MCFPRTTSDSRGLAERRLIDVIDCWEDPARRELLDKRIVLPTALFRLITNLSQTAVTGDRVMKYITAHWRGQLSLPMSYWVNGCVLTCLFVMFYIVVHDLVMPKPSDRMGMPLAILAIMFLNCPVLLTWQTMGLFRCARRRGGFWSVVAVLMFVAAWLQWAKVWGENLSPPAVVVRLVFLIAIFLIAFRRRPHPSDAASRPVERQAPA